MKILMLNLFIIAISLAAGIFIAEISYIILIFIKYLAYGCIDFEYSEILKGLRVGGTGGGILGIGIVIFRFFKVKGF